MSNQDTPSIEAEVETATPTASTDTPINGTAAPNPDATASTTNGDMAEPHHEAAPVDSPDVPPVTVETPPAEAIASDDVSEAADGDNAADSDAKTPADEAADGDNAADSDAKTPADEATPSDGDPDMTIATLKVGQHLHGTVKNITNFGAFVDIGIPQVGLVHISKLSRRKVEKVSDVVSEGQAVDVWVKKVDRKRGRISLTMIKPVKLRIKDIEEGAKLNGTVTRIESYGAFVDIDSDRDGLVHVSQITHEYIKHPEDALKVGQEVDVQILKVDRKKRQIDLSIKSLLPLPEPEPSPEVEAASSLPTSSSNSSKQQSPASKFAARREFAKEKPKREDKKNNKKSRGETLVYEDDEPVPTAMAIAYAAFQGLQSDDDDEDSGDTFSKNSERRKTELDAVINRTLATND